MSHHLDDNLRSLMKSTKPQLRLPLDRKAEILLVLQTQQPVESESNMNRKRWLGWAIAAVIRV